jgi:rhamnose utilization protein RhaD (predicted bifunctional aldolase and dehydrogenase)/NAD(P)-dependent dehydrogenase (short-subunit alcohol dehydrogenase family)
MLDETTIVEIMNTCPGISREMAERIHTSRLIGANTGWVLHGGGNTSVKQVVRNLFGEEQEVIYVKGSGRDLAAINVEDFTGLNLDGLRRLRQVGRLSDEEMENQLAINKLQADAPDPSVEALLHVFLPHKFIDHTHADAILALTSRTDAVTLIPEILGPLVCVIPYQKSGLPLAVKAFQAWELNQEAEALLVLNHGIFTFGPDAETAYQRMAHYIARAEAWLDKLSPADNGCWSAVIRDDDLPVRIAQIIRGACACPEDADHVRTLVVDFRDRSNLIGISLRPEAEDICRAGVLTPDHVIRTSNQYVHIARLPDTDEDLAGLIKNKVDQYKIEYEAYFKSRQTHPGQSMLDPSPRIFLVAGVGLFALGRTSRAARMAADIAEHTILTRYRAGIAACAPIDGSHIFEMEYWPLQQKKLGAAAPPPLEGKIALVTGAAGAIGFGIADRLLDTGAAVVISDIDQTGLDTVAHILAERHGQERVATACFDVTHCQSVQSGMNSACLAFGGLDILVPNAGTAYVAKIQDINMDKFRNVINVNLIGTVNVIQAAVPIFKRQNTGGNIIIISTKNVFDPGAAFGAYSASKAAAHQMGKIAALELAEIGVRVNMVNPDAVFGDKAVPSKLWAMIGPDRMKARGLDPEGLKTYYQQRNLLKVPVTAAHVGNAVVFFACNQTPTTGAALPVDGGVPAAFPR